MKVTYNSNHVIGSVGLSLIFTEYCTNNKIYKKETYNHDHHNHINHNHKFPFATLTRQVVCEELKQELI